MRFPQVAWTQGDYSSVTKESSFFVAAIQSVSDWLDAALTLAGSGHRRGYSQIVFYDVSSTNVLHSYLIPSAITPIKRQLAIALKASGLSASSTSNYNVYYVTTPSRQNWLDEFTETFDTAAVAGGTQSSFGINCFTVGGTSEYQT